MTALGKEGAHALGMKAEGSCPEGFHHLGDGCYFLSRNAFTWPEALTICENSAADLAVIETEGENSLVKGWIRGQRDGIMSGVWISGNDILEEGHWVYAMSQRGLVYTDWAPNEPNHMGTTENCIELQKYTDFRWNDNNCEQHRQVLCKRS
ncbi:hypothetical protein ScPMuIL_012771 [Solemya velum]